MGNEHGRTNKKIEEKSTENFTPAYNNNAYNNQIGQSYIVDKNNYRIGENYQANFQNNTDNNRELGTSQIIKENDNQIPYTTSNNQMMQNKTENINSTDIYNKSNIADIEKNQNPYLKMLNKSYQLFQEGNDLSKQFSFYEALFKFEEALKITTNVYYKITDDEILKSKVDLFLKNINSQIDFVNFQIKNRFNYKEKAGFASKDNEKSKVDYLESLRKNNFDINDNQLNVTYKIRSGSKDIANNNPNRSNTNTKDNSENTNLNSNNNKNIKNDDSKVVSSDLRSRILSEIVDNKPGVKFSDVIGLDNAKQILKEIIVLPSLRPDLFTGLRSPPRGLLLFGPPGVGKTMIAKAVATECQCTFFNISASSLTSKYLGESEKLVRALFDLAFEKQPSVVFIDEIESILSKRSDGENDATRRLKTEFLVQFDGVGSDQSAKILIIGATNRPQELDTAVLRRLPKRIYIGPFNMTERKSFIKTLMSNNENDIKDEDYEFIAKLTNNYSNSDLKELCREAAYEPIREISNYSDINKVNKLRPTTYEDFLKATKKVRGTLNEEMLKEFESWNQLYGAIY